MFTLSQVLETMKKKGYTVFDNDTKEFNLNLIGARNPNPQPNKFDDFLYVLWKFRGAWNFREFQITTDPGSYWLLHPLNVEGTAILTEGQHAKMWAVGMHRGAYEALVQVAPVTVIRDTNKDNRLDFNAAKKDTGLFGINLHHALAAGTTQRVDKFSAGCQVFAKIEDFNYFMTLARRARDNFGNSFTYTLLNFNDFK